MNVFISVDMEGVAGVVHIDQTRTNGQDYPRFRKLMTAEANAAALGAFDAGAKHVLINDSHGDARNIIIEDLDSRVELLSGNLTRYYMMEGIDRGHDVALFVGYHGGAGTQNAVLDHTYAGACVHRMSINGVTINEAYINALLAGHFGVPVGLIAGDESTCKETARFLKGIETAVVKSSVSRYAAGSLHPSRACDLIRSRANKAVRSSKPLKPFKVKPPYEIEITMLNTGMADKCELMPGIIREDGFTVSYKSKEIPEMYRAILCMVELAFSSIPQVRVK